MTQILALLISAMNLLVMVQGNPNVTPEFRATATSVANYAISVAQESLKTPVATSTPQDVVVATSTMPVGITQPLPQVQNFGTIQPTNPIVMETPFIVESTISKKVFKNAFGDPYVEVEINILNGSDDMTWEGTFGNGYHKSKVRPKSQVRDYINWISFGVTKNGDYPVTFSLNGKTFVQNVTVNEL